MALSPFRPSPISQATESRLDRARLGSDLQSPAFGVAAVAPLPGQGLRGFAASAPPSSPADESATTRTGRSVGRRRRPRRDRPRRDQDQPRRRRAASAFAGPTPCPSLPRGSAPARLRMRRPEGAGPLVEISSEIDFLNDFKNMVSRKPFLAIQDVLCY